MMRGGGGTRAEDGSRAAPWRARPAVGLGGAGAGAAARKAVR
jgi:hypothetical protein